MKTLFDLCVPRDDVRRGVMKDSDFAADLAQVLRKEAPDEYANPASFFANTHPTQGLRNLLRNVCLRLSGKGGEAASIFRLDTQYGGGKTHSLIALAHAAQGMKGVVGVDEFVEPDLVPRQKVRVAAFDGENADPVNGRALGHGLKAHTPWGELAYALADASGYETVRRSDEERVAPGADTLRALFGGKPTLILLDELSVYLRKVRGRRDAEQLTPFLTALFKAVESSPGAALVFTLAIGKGGKATDAYSEENQWVASRLDEAESVAARKATLLDPTAEHEIAQVLRRRLFKKIDDAGVSEIVEEFRKVWYTNKGKLPEVRVNESRPGELQAGYPFHPALMGVLTDKLSTLANFQRVRGMLRLLTQTVAHLWQQQPTDTYAIHLHHIDPGYDRTRREIVTRLEMGAFDPAIRNDVAALEGAVALAQQLDATTYSGLPPYGSFVARTILWHSLAFNEPLKGATERELRYAILGPKLDAGFIDDARSKFASSSAYLDDRPGAPLRFLIEANLEMMIRRQESLVDLDEARTQLNGLIRGIFGGEKSAKLSLVPFPSGPYDVDDDVGSGRPYLVLLSYDAASVRAEALRIPELVERIFKAKGSQNAPRDRTNNLVFLVADETSTRSMKDKMLRRLALEAMCHPDRLAELAEHQRSKVQEKFTRSEAEVAIAIQQCYRHLFFPSRKDKVEGAAIEMAHTAFDVQSASEKPGDGQKQILRALADNNKLLRAEDPPLAPTYVRDNAPLRKGQMSTLDLRDEFRKEPKLPIMLGDENFFALIRRGVNEGTFVYQSGDLIWGQGEAAAQVKIDAQSFVLTAAFARDNGIWPRPKKPSTIPPSEEAQGGAQEPGAISARHTNAAPIVSNAPVVPPPLTEEGTLKEALTRIWEKARKAKIARLATLRLRLFEVTDAFKLLSAIGSVPGADKLVDLTAEYETRDGSSLEMTFRGLPQDGLPLKDYLEPQFRDAKEKNLNATYTLTFGSGLDLAGDAAEKLSERLCRFATGAAYVEAEAEAAT